MKRIFYSCIVLSIIALASCSSPKKVKTEDASATTGATEQTSSKNNTQMMTKVLFKTTFGDITVALYDDTPQHKANFIKLVNDKFYDGVLFHRIIKGFMIQGGDPNSKTAKAGQRLGDGDVGYTIPAEFVAGHYHKRGALAAAREPDQVNPQKASSGCQFYIVDGTVYDNDKMTLIAQRTGKTFSPEQVQAYTTVGGAPWLDGDYTVFGEVIKGMDVVDKIAGQQKDGNDRPLEDIKIISATILR
ncbi:MAG: peptidylprolyl isomerase [Bacteroidales bacterium]|jgi:peptidyl-prolyl cis-trans isomerase B (cyclophilin B)|nr:peptidylprolyl isomerase [Bacteroidales bacterium]